MLKKHKSFVNDDKGNVIAKDFLKEKPSAVPKEATDLDITSSKKHIHGAKFSCHKKYSVSLIRARK